MKILTFSASLVVASTVLAGSAAAQSQDVGFGTLDRDGDGFIDYQEWKDPAVNSSLDRASFQAFKMFDDDDDGRLTDEEYRVADDLNISFVSVDRDGDGFIDYQEWKEPAVDQPMDQASFQAFKMFDTDDDEQLTDEEYGLGLENLPASRDQ